MAAAKAAPNKAAPIDAAAAIKPTIKVEANGVVSIVVTVGRKRYPALLMTSGEKYTSMEVGTQLRDEVVAALKEAIA
jgi:hypothetical protein